jgi:hypothetical protein
VIEKRVFLTGERARELEALARASGESESALVEEALDLLLVERRERAELKSDRAAAAPRRFRPEDVVAMRSTPIPPELLIDLEEAD